MKKLKYSIVLKIIQLSCLVLILPTLVGCAMAFGQPTIFFTDTTATPYQYKFGEKAHLESIFGAMGTVLVSENLGDKIGGMYSSIDDTIYLSNLIAKGTLYCSLEALAHESMHRYQHLVEKSIGFTLTPVTTDSYFIPNNLLVKAESESEAEIASLYTLVSCESILFGQKVTEATRKRIEYTYKDISPISQYLKTFTTLNIKK